MNKDNFKKLKHFFLYFFIYSVILSFFYNYFVKKDVKKVMYKIPNVMRQLRFNLPEEDVYLIKIWGEKSPDKVYCNSRQVFTFYERMRGKLKEQYFKIDAALSHKGQNTLSIISGSSYSVRIRNFVSSMDSDNFFVFFKSSKLAKISFFRVLASILPITISIFFLGLFFYFITSFFVKFNIETGFFLYFFSFLGFFLLLSIILLGFIFTPYRIGISISAFICLGIIILFLADIIVFYLLTQKRFKSKFSKNCSRQLLSGLRMLGTKSGLINKDKLKFENIVISSSVLKLQSHFTKCSDKLFIASGVFLLILCAIFLIFKLESIAHGISYIAYFALFAGLIMQYVQLIRGKD